jgi:hypothetical protein
MARGVPKCPNCGTPVSAFAAGCAVCGADLEAARARQATKPRLELPGLPSFGATGGIDWIQLVIALILAVGFSTLGLVLSMYWAVRHQRYSETTMTVLMLVTAAISLAAILHPYWFGNNLGV